MAIFWFCFLFFLTVPKTKILATGGASHNRDILQVSAGSKLCTRASSVSNTFKSKRLSSNTGPVPTPAEMGSLQLVLSQEASSLQLTRRTGSILTLK